MPDIINQCKSVWCWDEEKSVQDYSNLISESFFCNVPVFISSYTSSKDELSTLFRLQPELIITIDPMKDLGLANLIPKRDLVKSFLVKSEQTRLFNEYIKQDIEFYHSIQGSSQ